MKYKLFLLFGILLSGTAIHAVPGTLDGIKELPPKLRAEAREILKKYADFEKTRTPNSSLRLDLDDGIPTTIYSKAGIFNTQECGADFRKNKNNPDQQCQGVGWPDNSAVIKPAGEIEFRVHVDVEGNETLHTYSKVNFSYERGGKKGGTGWIPQDYLSFKPTTGSFSQISIEKSERAKAWVKDDCDEICKLSKRTHKSATPPPANLAPLAKISEAINMDIEKMNRERKHVSTIAEKLYGKVGMCATKPSNQAPKSFSGPIAYDQYALPLLRGTSIPADIKNEKNEPMSSKELADIDALARTIFAEIASCTPIGAQYPMAVARVIKNREMEMQEKPGSMGEFINQNNRHHPDKSLLNKAATSPVLFSAWNQEIIDFDALKGARAERAVALTRQGLSKAKAQEKANKEVRPNANSDPKLFYKKNDSGLLHSLCPPASPSGICYTGATPTPELNSVWKNILRIATEAILLPKQFLAKTNELKGIKHYTSDRTKFYNFKQVFPSIEGRQINSKRCLNLWVAPPEKSSKKKKK